MKVDISTVVESLKHAKLDPAVVRRIIEELNQAAESKAADKEPAKRGKNQLVVLASDPEGKLKGIQLAAWVLQIEEEGSPALIVDRIKQAGHTYNATKKGQLYPVKTIGEIIENVPRKLWKTDDESVRTVVKTKTPCLLLTSDNRL